MNFLHIKFAYFAGGGLLLIDKFSASDAKLVSKSPVSKALDVCWEVAFLPVFWMPPCEEVGCKTPPRASKADAAKQKRKQTQTNILFSLSKIKR